VEASFLPGVLDAMVKVPDVWSLAAMHVLSQRLGRRVGGSTGTNLMAALACAQELRRRNEAGAIVTLLCDGGERYGGTYFSDAWLAAQGLACAAERGAVEALIAHGRWPDSLLRDWRLAGELGGAMLAFASR
jgi:cysteine synthase A